MDPRQLTPLIVAALFIFMLYRRVRRQIGAQAVMPKRMTIRLAILTLASGLLLASGLHASALLQADGAGFLLGAVLAVLGLKMTRFEWRDEKLFYVPNLYVGLVVIALIAGRVVYKMELLYRSGALNNPQAAQANQAALHSPITLAVVMTLIGYYLVYYAGILLKSRSHHAAGPA
jgi:hypothetical protein